MNFSSLETQEVVVYIDYPFIYHDLGCINANKASLRADKASSNFNVVLKNSQFLFSFQYREKHHNNQIICL